jgi:hypothetical protein
MNLGFEVGLKPWHVLSIAPSLSSGQLMQKLIGLQPKWEEEKFLVSVKWIAEVCYFLDRTDVFYS